MADLAEPRDNPGIGPQPAVIVVRHASGLAIAVEVTWYCYGGPGKTYFRINQRGRVRVVGTSAALESESGVDLCALNR